MQGMIPFWKADHLRISLFSDKFWNVDPAIIFTEIFALVPETSSNTRATGEAVAVGVWSSNRVEVRRTINRIDCILLPTPTSQPELPLLSDVASLLPVFTSKLSDWAQNQTQEVVRIALGCGGILEVADITEGYKKLRDLVRVIKIDVDRFRDFSFQVNLSTQSKGQQELLLNRLTTWAVVQAQLGIIGGPSTAVQNRSLCTCVIDINTDANRTIPLEKSGIKKLLDEICQEAIHLLDQGIE